MNLKRYGSEGHISPMWMGRYLGGDSGVCYSGVQDRVLPEPHRGVRVVVPCNDLAQIVLPEAALAVKLVVVMYSCDVVTGRALQRTDVGQVAHRDVSHGNLVRFGGVQSPKRDVLHAARLVPRISIVNYPHPSVCTVDLGTISGDDAKSDFGKPRLARIGNHERALPFAYTWE